MANLEAGRNPVARPTPTPEMFRDVPRCYDLRASRGSWQTSRPPAATVRRRLCCARMKALRK